MVSREQFQRMRAGVPPVEAETPAASAGTAVVPDRAMGGKSPLATKLEALTEKSIGKLDEIIDLPLDRADPHFGGVLRAQTAAANTTLTTQTRVDERALRQREIDRLPELLELVRQVQARLPPQPSGPASSELTEGGSGDDP
jgi:hypothetical protein